jgi:hypothetical protein
MGQLTPYSTLKMVSGLLLGIMCKSKGHIIRLQTWILEKYFPQNILEVVVLCPLSTLKDAERTIKAGIVLSFISHIARFLNFCNGANQEGSIAIVANYSIVIH